MRIKSVRIKTKIILFVVPVLVIGLLLITGFSLFIYQSHLKTIVYDDLDDVSNGQRYVLSKLIDKIEEDFYRLVREPNLIENLDQYIKNNNSNSNYNPNFNHHSNRDSNFNDNPNTKNLNFLENIKDFLKTETNLLFANKTINIVNLSGKIIASTNKDNVDTYYTSFPIEFIRKAIKVELFDLKNNTIALKIAGPIISKGRAVGVLDLNILSDDLANNLINIQPGINNSGKNMLVKNIDREKYKLIYAVKNDDGVISVREDTINKGDSQFVSLEKLLKGDSSSFVSYDGIENIALAKEVPRCNWFIVSMVDKSEAYKELYKVVAYNLFFLFFVIILITVVVYLVACAITKPLTELTNALKKYEDNGIIKEINIEGEQETRILSSVLNKTIKKLKNQLENDLLTGLPNRYFISQYLLKSLDEFGNDLKPKLAVFFIKIQGVNTVNQTLGYEYGDKLLREVSKRFKHFIDESIVLARFDGSEFVAVINKYVDEDELSATANIIINIFMQSFILEKHLYKLSVNIGISQYPLDTVIAKDLFQYADIASLYAIQNSFNTYQFYNKEIGEKWQYLHWVKDELYKAINNDELMMYYQPQIDAKSNKIIGVESLMRWRHPTVGFINPSEFIDLAEKNNMIRQLTEIAVLKSFEAFDTLRTSGVRLEKMCINLSVRDFERQDLAKYLLDNIQKFSIPAHHVTLEITESILITDPNWIMSIITQLKSLGFVVALDDFGKGFSGLSILYKLPIDIIKLDKTFIDELPDNDSCQDIASTVLDLGKRLNKMVLAEGVETEEQLKWLLDHGCHLFQGYYFARPMPLDELLDFCQRWPNKK